MEGVGRGLPVQQRWGVCVHIGCLQMQALAKDVKINQSGVCGLEGTRTETGLVCAAC